MTAISKRWLKDRAEVETYRGQGAYGPVYGPKRPIRCRVEFGRELVRKSDGEETVSEAKLFCHPNDVAYLVPGSRISIGEYVTEALQVAPFGLPGRLTYIRVVCA